MASSKAPSNDFAPAWLKIPPQPATKGTSKSGGASSSHDRKSVGRNGRNGDNNFGAHPAPRGIQRQRSFDAHYNDPRPNPSKYRHHSLDGYYDDYYYGYYDDYYGYQSYMNHSQGYKRNNKYQHPNSRPPYDAFSYYHYGYPYEHNFADPPYYVNSRPYFNHEAMKNERNTSDKPRKNQNSKESFNAEFPTLGNGNSSKSTGSPVKTANGGAWEKPNNKVFSQPSRSSTTDTPNQTDSKDSTKSSSNIYKASVPNKGLSARKPPTEDSDNVLLDGDQTSLKSNSTGDNKHDIRDTNSNKINGFHQGDTKAQDIVNGVAHLQVDSSPSQERKDDVFLSSSLEAEQRLLREMGWNETDEEEYEITEDDMREFQNLSKQIKEQCNGQIRSTQLKWPAKDLVSVAPVADLGDCESSDESDLDSD